MEMVRHGHHHEIPRRERGQHLLEQLGEHLLRRLVQAGIGFESLAGKGLGETGRFGQGPQRRRVQGANANAADAAHPLQVINGGQDLVVRNHAAADDRNFELAWG